MNRDTNADKKKPAVGLNGNNRKNGRASRYRPQKERRAITEDERFLQRPTRQLVSPTEPIPQEQVKEEEHSLDRALHVDFKLTDSWRVFRIMSGFLVGLDELSHIPQSVAIFRSARTMPAVLTYQTAV